MRFSSRPKATAAAHRLRRAAVLAAGVLASSLVLTAGAGGSEPTVTIFTAGITPGSGPNAMTRGPDGAMWFTEYHGDKIGRVSADGNVTEYPSGGETGANPSGITTGPDGDIWFSVYGAGAIGQVDPATGELLGEYKIPNGGSSHPDGIISGPGGDLWFAEQGEGEIGRIDPGTHVIEQFAVDGATNKEIEPASLATGPEGDIWFTLTHSGQVGRLDPEKLGGGKSFTLYDLPSGSSSDPEGITLGPEGNLYLAELGADRIARVEPGAVEEETSKGITEFSAGASPLLATSTSEGTIWFTSASGHELIRFDPAHPEEPTFVGAAAGVTGDPTGLAEDTEGHLWFTQFKTAAVGRLALTKSTTKGGTPPPSQGAPPPPVPVAAISATTLDGKQVLSAAASQGNGSAIVGYALQLNDGFGSATIHCGPGGSAFSPSFAEPVKGTAVLTVDDADGQSASSSVGFSFGGTSAIGGFAKPKPTAKKAGTGFDFEGAIGGIISYQCLPLRCGLRRRGQRDRRVHLLRMRNHRRDRPRPGLRHAPGWRRLRNPQAGAGDHRHPPDPAHDLQ